ncbi:MAG TPA: hypothetical protein ENN79_03480 [Desulfobacteraceae bacterium]|nr:hypothetical protein [Desulfobacteraceae bacterium]
MWTIGIGVGIVCFSCSASVSGCAGGFAAGPGRDTPPGFCEGFYMKMLYLLYVSMGLWYKSDGILERDFREGDAGRLRIQ